MLDDEYEDDEDEVAYGESKVLAEIPADVDPEMARAMETFPQWTQQEIQGYFDQGGPLNRSKIGSTISEWNPCLPRDGPMRSGKTRTAAPWSFTAPCRRSSIPTPCDLASRGTALHYWSPRTWLTSGCKKKDEAESQGVEHDPCVAFWRCFWEIHRRYFHARESSGRAFPTRSHAASSASLTATHV